MKRGLKLFLVLVVFSIQPAAYSLEILLTSPTPTTSANKVRVSDISDHPDRKQMSIRMTVGYVDAEGEWREVEDYHELIENIGAVLDDPKTPEDEAQPAQPKYDTLQNLLKSSGKTAEEIILNRAKAKFPGIVQ